jgi:hypothetical protein
MIIKANGAFVPAPEGLHKAVCVDVVDKGILETPWGEKPKIRIIWEIEAAMDDGRRFIVGKTYTASLHEKSNLHKDLRSWRGRPFTAEELAGFDMDKVIGVPCQLLVTHTERDGTVFANVAAVTKAQGTPLKPTGSYVRMKDRRPLQPAASLAEQGPAEEEIPF